MSKQSTFKERDLIHPLNMLRQLQIYNQIMVDAKAFIKGKRIFTTWFGRSRFA